MKHFKRIAACIDFSDFSGMALIQALHLAQAEQGKISAIYVAEPDEVGDFEGNQLIATDIAEENLRDNLRHFVSHYGGTPDLVECKVLIGKPSNAIARYVQEHPTDLVVLGSRGNDSMARHTGHFATKCVRHCPVPVLLSRRQSQKRFRKIVACIDFSAASQEVVRTAAQIAQDEDAELHVIHAATPPWLKPSHVMYTLEPIESKDFQKDYSDMLQNRLEALVSDVMGKNQHKFAIHILEHVSPDRAIINYLNDNQADLAVVGRLGHLKQIVSQCFIGTTAEKLIWHSPCAVLTVPCNPGNESS